MLTFIKTTFAFSEENNIANGLAAICAGLFSNILNLPILLIAIFVYGRVSSFYQAKRTKFYYQPTNKLYVEMMRNGKLVEMVSTHPNKILLQESYASLTSNFQDQII
jgi:hypothetical protein